MRFPGKSLRSGFSSLSPVATICLGVLSSACGLIAPSALAKTTGDLIAARQIPLPGNLNPYYSGIAVADVNGDHRQDFVLSETVTDPVTAANTQVIQTLINNGDGTVRAVPALADIHGQNVMALADLNGDGIQDLVCTFGYEDPNAYKSFLIDVEVSFGHGDGTFAAPEKYTVNGRLWGLKTGDINGDGKIDILVAAAGIYFPLINKGDGTFKNGYSYQAVTGNGFTLADVNGDGRADLLIPENFHLTIAFGTTSGAFGNTKGVSIRQFASPPVVGDINGDHVMDIVVPTNEGVDILIGDGAGDFHAGTPVNAGPALAVYLSDLDRNGKLDLLISLNSTNIYTQTSMHRISVYPGNGDGTFGAPRVYNGPGGSSFLGVFDVMGTHAADVVMGGLIVLPGDGYGSLLAAPITRSPDANGIATGDFNRDGKIDVVVTNGPECYPCPTTLTFFPGTGNTWLGAPKSYPTGVARGDLTDMQITVGDVNNDGKLDVVMAGADSDVVSILLGNGDGSFQTARIIDLGTNYSTEVYLADVNNDGKQDLVLDSGVMLGNGNGTFGSLIAYPAFPLRGISAVGVADLNGDGKPDIAAGIDIFTGPYTPDVFEMAILLGDGKGNFTTSAEWTVHELPFQIIPAHMHPSGLPDLVVRYTLGGGGVSILSNDGHGKFPTKLDPDYFTGERYIAVGDFNGDGINDVAAMSFDQVTIMLGKGDGTLQEPVNPPYPHSFSALSGPLAVGDINHDGALDVVTASPLGVSRFINAAIPAP